MKSDENGWNRAGEYLKNKWRIVVEGVLSVVANEEYRLARLESGPHVDSIPASSGHKPVQ
jgi:hypothetical protein